VTCDAEYGQVWEWANLSREEIPLHPFANRLRAAILDAHCVAGSDLLCYRGQSLERDSCPSVDRLGPPPEDLPPAENRYNRVSESVLYLCDSEAATAREVTLMLGHELYCLVYRLPLQRLRIADFTEPSLAPLVNEVFEIAETHNVEGRGPATWGFSQFVGQLVAEVFDGMMVPGVRGAPSFRYSNIVVFRPHPRWREWVVVEPRVLRPLPESTGE
jgi:hypothetical protein